MAGVTEFIRDNWEKTKLLGYFAIIVALAIPLANMLGAAWERAILSKAGLRLWLLTGVEGTGLVVFLLGTFVGFLTLMSIDPKKRWQAALLWLGTGIGLLGLQSQDLLLSNINIIENAVWFGGGLVVAVVFGGGRKIVTEQTVEAFEFRRASQSILVMLSLVVIVSLAEYHLQYPNFVQVSRAGVEFSTIQSPSLGLDTNNLPTHLVVSGVFLITLRRFVQYDAEESFFVLGPPASGKSLFLIGAYLEALDSRPDDGGATPMKPSQDLMEMVEMLDRQEQQWIIEATGRGELNQLDFQFVHGSVFPTNVQLSGLDYAGEYLSRLPDAIAGPAPDDEDRDTTLYQLAAGVQSADTLILLLDMERFVNNEPLEISEYFSILQATNNKNVLLVATKTDVVAERFREERGLEPHRHFEDFRTYVNSRLRESEQVDSLIREIGGKTIHPVYYQTRENEVGDRVPMRDQDGSVMTVGFDVLLQQLGK